MQTSLFVSTRCPECNGSARHLEGAHTFTCSFCASVLRCQTEGRTLKYVISPRLERDEIVVAFNEAFNKALPNSVSTSGSAEVSPCRPGRIKTIYKPFWYCKGMVYSCHSSGTKNGLDARAWSHTFEANSSVASALTTLGLRSEVLEADGFDSEQFGADDIVLPITKSKEEARKEAVAAAEWGVENPGWKYHETTIVGERFVLLYYPVIAVEYSDKEENGTTVALFDGVAGTGLGKEVYNKEESTEVPGNAEQEYRVKFVTHRCANCGHDLKPGDSALFFHCAECSRLWLLDGDDYRQQKITLLAANDGFKGAYIPFWRFELSLSSKAAGLELGRIGDLAEFMRMGRHTLRDEAPERPLRFFVPAMLAPNPGAVIKLAARIGTFQKELPVEPGEVAESDDFLNVSLPVQDAKEMLRPLIFLVIGRIDREAVKFYSDFEITVAKKELVWYPFEEKGAYLLDPFHNYTFPRRSLVEG
ncbi:MAG: hypothetical protein IME99_03380 [Proteobacteria bacterium]|nr:hypothetical protein [Pseudomonadota bacterium]